LNVLEELDRIIVDRIKDRPHGSYTAMLAERGVEYTARKVGEEAVEVIVAALSEDGGRLVEEAADLLYMLSVLLRLRGTSILRVLDVLEGRMH